jgi:hypothetical protein
MKPFAAAILTIALTSPMSLWCVPPAHADDNSFLDYVHSRGVPDNYFGASDNSNLMAGDMICRMLRTGHTVDQLPFLGLQQESYKPTIVEGAQHELCPDTL